MTRLIVPAMRSAPEASSRDENFSALRPDLRQRMPAVVAGISRSLLRATMYEERKKEAERRTTQIRIHRTFRYGARFAKRARPSAFHHGSVPLGLFIPRLNLGQAS
jgi:hypothetical protein